MSDDIKFGHVTCADAEPYHYLECGLDNVFLCGGYTVESFKDEKHVSVMDAYALHQAIGRILILQKRAPNGKEIRFLRREMNLTQNELASLVGVTDQTIARYEKDENELPGPTDRLLRALYLDHLDGKVDVIELAQLLAELDETTDHTFEMSFNPTDGWSSRLAA